jgi:hypothetical protein
VTAVLVRMALWYVSKMDAPEGPQPAGDARPRRASPGTLRIVRTVVAVAFAWAATAIPLWLTGIAGARAGWLWASAAFFVTLGAFAWVLWGEAPGRPTAVRIVGVVAVVSGLALAARAPLGSGRLEDAIRIGDTAVPGTTRLHTDRFGNPLCVDDCPGVSRVWLVPRAAAPLAAAVDEHLRGRGCTPGTPAGVLVGEVRGIYWSISARCGRVL